MDTQTELIVEPEVVETPTEVIETPESTDDVIEAEVIETSDAAEGSPAEESPEAIEEAVEVAETPEPVVFDTELPVSELIEQGTEHLDKYELPQEVSAYIEALQAKAQVQPLAEFADYGDPEAVKVSLEREAYITSMREENGRVRPNTDKFLETLSPERAEWLAYDVNARPSAKYPGLTQFEEHIADTFAIEGDTAQSVVERYHAFTEAMRANAIPSAEIPSSVPKHLYEAYGRLSKQTRDEIAELDPSYDEDAQVLRQRLTDLELMQKGIDSDKAEKQRVAQAQQAEKEGFANAVMQTQGDFFTAFRNECAKDLASKVTFSEDPKMQTLLANQQIALLTQAFDDGIAGQFARDTLEKAGIQFDYPKAQTLLQKIELAAVNLETHKKSVNGQRLDEVAFNKAKNAFQNVGREWTQFAKETLDQVARVASTGKAEDVKKAAEKIKVAAKARPNPNGVAKAAQSKPATNPYRQGTPQFYEWEADQILAQRAKQVRAYA